eukprot:m.215808 g.215808  ORF g.215808 m.215808 type:complete len:118 (-) comp33193_c0_seq1:106-459(-)
MDVEVALVSAAVLVLAVALVLALVLVLVCVACPPFPSCWERIILVKVVVVLNVFIGTTCTVPCAEAKPKLRAKRGSTILKPLMTGLKCGIILLFVLLKLFQGSTVVRPESPFSWTTT